MIVAFKSLLISLLFAQAHSGAVPFYEISTGQIINVNIDAHRVDPYKTYELTLDDSDGNKLTALHVREVVPHGSPLLKDSPQAQAQFDPSVVEHYSVEQQPGSAYAESPIYSQTHAQEQSSPSGQYQHFVQPPGQSGQQDQPTQSVQQSQPKEQEEVQQRSQLHPVITSRSMLLEEEEETPPTPDMFEINQFGVDPISLLALQAGAGGFGGGFGGHGGHGGGKKGGGGFGAEPVLVVQKPYAVPQPFLAEQQQQQFVQQQPIIMQQPVVQQPIVMQQKAQPVVEQMQVQPVMQQTKMAAQPIYQPTQWMNTQTTVNPPIYAQPTVQASTTWQTQAPVSTKKAQ